MSSERSVKIKLVDRRVNWRSTTFAWLHAGVGQLWIFHKSRRFSENDDGSTQPKMSRERSFQSRSTAT
ncbi:hypothetical protein Y032_0990g3310 [Ancylostoma ceylanicum]|uniref:Uncharacterized protein n=1 Tax=Ancylostoma ceylanicum TaxID=53326 RepID=A0A016W8X1_9BILA|nr:hypothetical protein Y032_0990g3310 [Ancylostoma ceylanicum]